MGLLNSTKGPYKIYKIAVLGLYYFNKYYLRAKSRPMLKYISFLVFFTVVCNESSYAQSRNIDQEARFKEIYKTTKSLVSTNQYQYVGTYVFDNRRRERLESGTNTLIVNSSQSQGTIRSLREDNLSYSLNGQIKDYKVEYGDAEQTINISYKVNTPSETMEISIAVKRNGNAFLTLNTATGQRINWTGMLTKL